MSAKYKKFDDLKEKTKSYLDSLAYRRQVDEIKAMSLGVSVDEYQKLDKEEVEFKMEDFFEKTRKGCKILEDMNAKMEAEHIHGRVYYENVFLPENDEEYSLDRKLNNIISHAEAEVEEEFEIISRKINLHKDKLKYINDEINKVAEIILDEYSSDDYNSMGLEWHDANMKFPTKETLKEWYYKGKSFENFIYYIVLHQWLVDYKLEIDKNASLEKKADTIRKTKTLSLKKQYGGLTKQALFTQRIYNLFIKGFGDTDFVLINSDKFSVSDLEDFLFSKGEILFSDATTWGDVYNVAVRLKKYINGIVYKSLGTKCNIDLGRTPRKQKDYPKHREEIDTIFKELEQKLQEN